MDEAAAAAAETTGCRTTGSVGILKQCGHLTGAAGTAAAARSSLVGTVTAVVDSGASTTTSSSVSDAPAAAVAAVAAVVAATGAAPAAAGTGTPVPPCCDRAVFRSAVKEATWVRSCSACRVACVARALCNTTLNTSGRTLFAMVFRMCCARLDLPAPLATAAAAVLNAAPGGPDDGAPNCATNAGVSCLYGAASDAGTLNDVAAAFKTLSSSIASFTSAANALNMRDVTLAWSSSWDCSCFSCTTAICCAARSAAAVVAAAAAALEGVDSPPAAVGAFDAAAPAVRGMVLLAGFNGEESVGWWKGRRRHRRRRRRRRRRRHRERERDTQ